MSALTALGEQLSSTDEAFELAVIGGAALIALGLVDRATLDVDVVGIVQGSWLTPAEPFPPALAAAAARVARDLRLPADWLNPGPTDFVVSGHLPAGFFARAERRSFGPRLHVRFASRLDQIHFKLYAFADGGAGRHEQDLRALAPTPAELQRAAAWALGLNVPGPFDDDIARALISLGADGAG